MMIVVMMVMTAFVSMMSHLLSGNVFIVTMCMSFGRDGENTKKKTKQEIIGDYF
jgi:hypothetical protein